MLYLLSTSCVLTLASSILFLLFSFGDTLLLLSSRRRGGVHAELPEVRGLLGSCLPVDVPVAPSFREFRTCFIASALYQTFVINVINNIRILILLYFFTWYVLWYTVHSVVYTCDLILTHIWLFGLCPFINRVLHRASVLPPSIGCSDARASIQPVLLFFFVFNWIDLDLNVTSIVSSSKHCVDFYWLSWAVFERVCMISKAKFLSKKKKKRSS